MIKCLRLLNDSKFKQQNLNEASQREIIAKNARTLDNEHMAHEKVVRQPSRTRLITD